MDIRLQFLVLNALINLLNENRTEESLKLMSDIEKYLSGIDRRKIGLRKNEYSLPFYHVTKIADNEWESRLTIGYESSFVRTKKEAYIKTHEKLQALKQKVEKALTEIQEIVLDMKG